jgi:FKBP-type peptidyl-prolyl cis-trans isomerase
MKKLIIIPLICLPIVLSAQKKQQQKTDQPLTKTEQQAPVPETLKLTNRVDSTQYILGAYLGQYMQANGLAVTNANLFIKGMDDVLSAKPLMIPADSIPRRMSEYLTLATVERNKLLEKQLFDAVKGQPGVGSLPNGVCYVIVKAGTGMRPELTDSITVHVKGFLPDGKQFEDTYPKNIPLKTTLANMIPGLKETIQIMPAGSLWRIYIPSALGYAEAGVPGIIPPYSAIVFDIELLSIKEK